MRILDIDVCRAWFLFIENLPFEQMWTLTEPLEHIFGHFAAECVWPVGPDFNLWTED